MDHQQQHRGQQLRRQRQQQRRRQQQQQQQQEQPQPQPQVRAGSSSSADNVPPLDSTASSQSQQQQQQNLPLSKIVGNAVLLLKDWTKFGLAERVCYHFDLIGALQSSSQQQQSSQQLPSSSALFATVSSSGRTPSSSPRSSPRSSKKKVLQLKTVRDASRSDEDNGDEGDDEDERRKKGDDAAAKAVDNAGGAADRQRQQQQRQQERCGVSAVLECVPQSGGPRLRSDQKRRLKAEVRNLNAQAAFVKAGSEPGLIDDNSVCDGGGGGVRCFQPPQLPLKINSSSNVVFAYETTRIAFVVDASPTLTSTFGFRGRGIVAGAASDSDASCCCPLDRLVPMARTFFTSLSKPIRIQAPTTLGQQQQQQQQQRLGTTASSTTPTTTVWQPELAVSVLAVFPSPQGGEKARLLVRDYRIRDVRSAEILADKIEDWVFRDVEYEIASRMARRGGPADDDEGGNVAASITSLEAGLMPLYTSNLRDLLDAGDVALSTLSSSARPLVVLATDGRSLSCGAIIDILSDTDRTDIPIIVLDLSSPESHGGLGTSRQGIGYGDLPSGDENFHILSYDPVGALFPLHLSDDSETLHGICKATDGCFFDCNLLNEAARTHIGHVEPESPIFADHLFSNKRHVIRPNAVQWYTIFSLSPLSPRISSHLGKLAPPEYIRRRLKIAAKERAERQRQAAVPMSARSFDRPAVSSLGEPRRPMVGEVAPSALAVQPRVAQSRSTFWTYIVNPIRIKGLLMMRMKEGYRAKMYGSSTNEPDKVSIQFFLPLDLGNVLHYELSYSALPGHNHAVGFAHIKIELSGDAAFVQTVKNDFLMQSTARARPLVTMVQQVSFRLCELLRWIRKEDMLQSYLAPGKLGIVSATPSCLCANIAVWRYFFRSSMVRSACQTRQTIH